MSNKDQRKRVLQLTKLGVLILALDFFLPVNYVVGYDIFLGLFNAYSAFFRTLYVLSVLSALIAIRNINREKSGLIHSVIGFLLAGVLAANIMVETFDTNFQLLNMYEDKIVVGLGFGFYTLIVGAVMVLIGGVMSHPIRERVDFHGGYSVAGGLRKSYKDPDSSYENPQREN